MSSNAEIVGSVLGDLATGVSSTFVPAGVVQDVITLSVRYGVPAAVRVFNLWKESASGKPVTVTDVEAAFADLKPYEAYNIPDKVPVVAGPAA